MKKAVVGLLLVGAVVLSQSALADPHRFGVGARYNRAIESIDDQFDKDGVSYLLSYQFVPSSLFKIEADVEIMPAMAGIDGTAFAPQAYAMLGDTLYAGLGIGILYANDKFADSPYYNIRVGLDVPLKSLHVDVNVNYAFMAFDGILDNLSSDNVQLGLIARYEF